ncbi:ribonucleotide-diphosphate reductase subunit beta [Dyella telluris]|uniref:ribonucleoside-diphosphate reductase n=1 Tax=Dyella telluris TaxID=2763498 RepID=A0A7G8Q4M8_9GAMM|nr:ribonucleotide-diphosphate reductase subunit beta [Dyella telluris]QNK01736.1 ribonucleotide-diphosphate reductase subunit beta [Dyella telluris]
MTYNPTIPAGKTLFTERTAYKPFSFPWAYEAWHTQQKMHWLPEEVPMADDVQDWRRNLSPSEQNLLNHIFRFFVQSDVEISKSYHSLYLKWFKPTEIQMMLNAFNNMETIHIAAYSHLIDTLGLPEVEYEAFLKYREMKEKWEYLQGFYEPKDVRELALSMAVFGAFTEGLQLFASFAMLLNFPRFNKMKGMGQIITWSVRDESHHCENIIRLFHDVLRENPEVNDAQLRAQIEQACRDVVAHEDAFIDLAFEMGGVKGMTAEEIKQYIRYIADRRLIQLGYKGIFKVKENPLPWLDEMLNAVEHVNFFEQRGTEYAKAATQGTWGDVFAELDEPVVSAKPEWIVYTKTICPYCTMAKNMLKQKGITWTEISLDDDAERAKFYEQTGARSVPQILHNGKLVGGADKLGAYLREL